MGFYQGMYATGMLLGPLVAGFLSDKFGLPVVFYMGGGLGLVVLAMAFLPILQGAKQQTVEGVK